MMADQEQEVDRLREALEYAIFIMESYQMDIRNSWHLGVDLTQGGFCQGDIYQRAIEDIRHKAGISDLT